MYDVLIEHPDNLLICTCGNDNGFTALMTSSLPDLHFIGDTQCFPLQWFDQVENAPISQNLFEFDDNGVSFNGISDYFLSECEKKYKENISKETIFYYVYGLLHSSDYKNAFAEDLKKSLPRIPLVDSYDDFKSFSEAGRKLADLHLNYESVEAYRCNIVDLSSPNITDEERFSVVKMRFGKKDSADKNGKKKKVDNKNIIVYNDNIMITGIPEEAYDYVVNGKSAIEWILERYAISVDKASGIKNDPNDWSKEVGDPKYIFNLLLRIITVSLETLKIVDSLPKLNFD